MKLFTRRTLISFCLIVVFLILVFYAARYRKYAYAQVWHFRHGDTVKFGAYSLELPKQWWVLKNEFAGWTTISIPRACKSTEAYEPEIKVEATMGGETTDNDDEQYRQISSMVSSINHGPHSELDHLVTQTQTVTNFRSKNSTWYCMRETMIVFSQHTDTTLSCNAARIPYELYYTGPPEQEQEAISIFETFQ